MSARKAPFPQVSRLLQGLAAAPIAASATVAAAYSSAGRFNLADYLGGIVLLSFFTIPSGLLCGGLMFLTGWRLGCRPTLTNSLLGGGFCAILTLILALVFLIPSGISYEKLGSASPLTRAWSIFLFVAPYFVSGLMGGLVFWLCVIMPDSRYRTAS